MIIGIDDTDSREGMCTTYLGAVLISRLKKAGFTVREVRLIRLNPNVKFKTRGNAAIAIEADGDLEEGFALACAAVEELAEFDGVETNPGVAVVAERPDPAFYHQALQDFCTIAEAEAVLETWGARYRGYKNRRGLIGAAAAIASDLPDSTAELLAYRDPSCWGTHRQIDEESFFTAEAATFPQTWDTVDTVNSTVVCVPHTPDPVLFGIRGVSPAWVTLARSYLETELPALEQIYRTNQGTDAHLVEGVIGRLLDGRSYRLDGTVTAVPVTGQGGHVTLLLEGEDGATLPAMAYEPTKGFRDIIRALIPGDQVAVTGSYKGGSLNLEKLQVRTMADAVTRRPPLCAACTRRMTSAGRGQGYKCRHCGEKSAEPEVKMQQRTLACRWYEVPSVARRHLAKPLCRGTGPAPDPCPEQ
ncbi:tRNA(Ile)(2)-agmatinylcytidine synthase [Methanosphaerula palustris]|uniref:tRNA(Ile2) 2-agmatinylcytidine synthetase TiaS n=1 Tax=Methanosphaerula palustris (strain ATCC BAA-1556 / DSM 19958 / E1-9c) TaxID=521011 RepID=B8GI75_METPE|nr:tRNA(Ile)(2)-agmatinylcytidine synthase [Methanosphaerula palustris]ACL15426.1 domain of unknown function DUF1743 [Methanosphaerula palustris E1-9c]